MAHDTGAHDTARARETERVDELARVVVAAPHRDAAIGERGRDRCPVRGSATLKIVVGARPVADIGACTVTPAIARSPASIRASNAVSAAVTASHDCSAMNAAAPPIPAMVSNAPVPVSQRSGPG